LLSADFFAIPEIGSWYKVCQLDQERKYLKMLEQKTKISSELCVECLGKCNVVGIILLQGGCSNFEEDKVQ
jgi:hypothetical protein